MIFTALALAAAQADMRPIELPYQAIPPFQAYTQCIGSQVRSNPSRSDEAALRSANSAALAACAAVRQEQLERAIEAVSDTRRPLDTRTYRDRDQAREAVREAFDRFDRDFRIEQAPPPLVSNVPLTTAAAPSTEEGSSARDEAPPSAGGRGTLTRRPVLEGQFRIPDEIAVAVLPYMGCLLARDGVEVRGSFDPRPRDVPRGGDCSAYRERAERNADLLLRRQGMRSRSERSAFIERTLAAMEAFHATTHASDGGEERQ